MATSLRKERRKRILENREVRLRLILGEKENESEVISEQVSERSAASTLSSDKVECREHELSHDGPLLSKRENNRHFLKKDTGNENYSKEVKEIVRGKQCPSTSSTVSTSWVNKTENSGHRTFPDLNQSHSQVGDNADSLFTVSLNVLLASTLVIYERQWKLKQLRSTDRKDTTENGLAYQPSESFLWAFLALQMIFLCIPRYREVSHSSSIAMVSMALQLSGVSAKLITAVNLVLTTVLRMLSDFCMFVFGAVITSAVIDYADMIKLL